MCVEGVETWGQRSDGVVAVRVESPGLWYIESVWGLRYWAEERTWLCADWVSKHCIGIKKTDLIHIVISDERPKGCRNNWQIKGGSVNWSDENIQVYYNDRCRREAIYTALLELMAEFPGFDVVGHSLYAWIEIELREGSK